MITMVPTLLMSDSSREKHLKIVFSGWTHLMLKIKLRHRHFFSTDQFDLGHLQGLKLCQKDYRHEPIELGIESK